MWTSKMLADNDKPYEENKTSLSREWIEWEAYLMREGLGNGLPIRMSNNKWLIIIVF